VAHTEARDEIIDLIPPLRRYVGAHVGSHDDLDDVVQETLTRVIAARERLDPGVALAYSIVVARNVMADRVTGEVQLRTNRHRLIDLTRPEPPDQVVLRSEEQAALKDALNEVAPAQRDALLAHVLNDQPVTAIASDTGTSSGSVAAQLARTRARLRVEYLLALRRVELPTDRCMPVLLAVSAADTRRQQVLRAGHHLLGCPVCSSLSEPLLRRRSALAAILPWLGLGPLIGVLRRLVRNSPGQAAAAGTAATVGTVALVVAVHTATGTPADVPPAASSSPSASSAPEVKRGQVVRVSDNAPLLPVPADLPAMNGDQVRALAVPVLSVTADEGFWIGDARRGRIWVQLTDVGTESAVTVRATEIVSFTAKVARHGPSFARESGVDAGDGAALLTRQGAHLSVKEGDLKVGAP
jgi:RNA polymerase sigma factor (sigma-70 family)